MPLVDRKLIMLDSVSSAGSEIPDRAKEDQGQYLKHLGGVSNQPRIAGRLAPGQWKNALTGTEMLLPIAYPRNLFFIYWLLKAVL